MAIVDDEVRVGPWSNSERSLEEYLTTIGVEPTPVWSTKVGLLACIVHGSAWCDHIESLILRRQDADSIYSNYEGHHVRYLEVPIFPVDGVFARIFIHRRKSSRFDVFLNEPMDLPLTKKMKNINAPHLGILCPDEGRMVLRNMVLDWLEGIMPVQAVPLSNCESFRHGYDRKRILLDNITRNQRTAMLETWCLYWYRKCLGCLEEEGPVVEFDSDLIPSR